MYFVSPAIEQHYRQCYKVLCISQINIQAMKIKIYYNINMCNYLNMFSKL